MAKRKSFPANRRILTKEDIFNTPLRERQIYVEAWDGWLWIREMTAAQVQADGKFIIGRKGQPNYDKAVEVPTHIAARQVIDGEGGERLFSDRDIQRLKQMHGAAITQIADEVRKLSGLKRDADEDDLEAWLQENHPDVLEEYREQEYDPVKEAEENFTETPKGGSPSD